MTALRTFLLGSLLLVGSRAVCAAEVHMQILKEKKLLGYATVSQWLLPNGGKTVEMRMEIFGPSGNPTRLHKISTYDSNGHPQRMLLENVGPSRTETIATFDKSGAHLSLLKQGLTKTSSIELAANAPWGDASEFWFLRDHPKSGDHAQALLFSIDRLDWILTDVTFEGTQPLEIGTQKVMANVIRSDSDGRTTIAFLDDHGDPVRLELDGGIDMVRIPTSPKKNGPNG